MKRWITYLNERSPIIPLMIISSAMIASSFTFHERFNWALMILGIIANLLLLVQMRLSDEIKDYEKDKVVHPNRPLPRGLLKPQQLEKAFFLIMTVISCISVYIGFYSFQSGLVLFINTFFTWLMYKEFFVGTKLNSYPILYALSHQVIVIPFYGWPLLLGEVADWRIALAWLLCAFAGSFNFEICRKLNPNAHRLLNTYYHFYGKNSVLFMIIFLNLLSLLGLALMSAWLVFSLAALIYIVSLSVWFLDNKKYKIMEVSSVLMSLIVMWYPAVHYYLKG